MFGHERRVLSRPRDQFLGHVGAILGLRWVYVGTYVGLIKKTKRHWYKGSQMKID